MKKHNDTAAGLQFAFNCLAAIGLAIYLAGVFVYHLYTQRPELPSSSDQDDQA